MSRTHRKHLDHFAHANGEFYHWSERHEIYKQELEEYGIHANMPCSRWTWVTREFRGRDIKPWNKPPKWFKQMNRRIERAKVKEAIREGKFDNIPYFKKSDQWSWT
jgi:hypothetical protein